MRILHVTALVVLFTIPPIAAADPASTWEFDVATSGDNVFWMSPSSVNTNADLYRMRYEIENVTATVKYLVFNFDIDVTDQVPPEVRSGELVYPGPPPIVLFDGQVSYPEAPEPVGLAATINLSLMGDGSGQLSITNVILADVTTEVPGFGTVTVDVQAIRFSGYWMVQPLQLGDANCDGVVDTGDVSSFAMAVVSPNQYELTHLGCSLLTCDINEDGLVDGRDIAAFLELIL